MHLFPVAANPFTMSSLVKTLQTQVSLVGDPMFTNSTWLANLAVCKSLAVNANAQSRGFYVAGAEKSVVVTLHTVVSLSTFAMRACGRVLWRVCRHTLQFLPLGVFDFYSQGATFWKTAPMTVFAVDTNPFAAYPHIPAQLAKIAIFGHVVHTTHMRQHACA
tara:strand:- start:17009 stop:17494 length:486 start_codon:yes stop_codon:yes gene_type:complete